MIERIKNWFTGLPPKKRYWTTCAALAVCAIVLVKVLDFLAYTFLGWGRF